jgi:hypothetical protein
MEAWLAALARPTAAGPSSAAHNYALAWRTSRQPQPCRNRDALDPELRPPKHLVAEPCCERLAQFRVSAIANPSPSGTEST